MSSGAALCSAVVLRTGWVSPTCPPRLPRPPMCPNIHAPVVVSPSSMLRSRSSQGLIPRGAEPASMHRPVCSAAARKPSREGCLDKSGRPIAAFASPPTQDAAGRSPLPIYLDYNGTTPCSPAVMEAMLPYFRCGAGS